MITLLRIGMGLLGFLGGIAVAVTINACCPEPKLRIWDILPGIHLLDERLRQDSLHGDTEYQVEISADLSQGIETYKRNGKAYRAIYTLGPAIPNELRSDTNLGHECTSNKGCIDGYCCSDYCVSSACP